MGMQSVPDEFDVFAQSIEKVAERSGHFDFVNRVFDVIKVP